MTTATTRRRFVPPRALPLHAPRRSFDSGEYVATAPTPEPCGRCGLVAVLAGCCSACGSTPRPCPHCLGAASCVLCDDNGMVWS